MPGYESRMGWSDEINAFAASFMAQMGKTVNEWATKIILREGEILDKIDDQIRKKEENIAIKESIIEKAEREVEILNINAMKAKKEWQRWIDEASRFKYASNKYILEKGILDSLDPASKEYKTQAARVKSMEPKYKQWVEASKKTNEKLLEYQELTKKADLADKKRRNLSLHGTKLDRSSLALEKKYELGQLEKDKELLEGAIAKNMNKNRVKLVKAFTDKSYVASIAGMIANTIDSTLNKNLRFDEFSEDEIFNMLEEIFKIVQRDKLEKFNFLKVLAETKKYYSTIDIGGKKVKVFDMDNITVDDMMKVFSGWLRYSVGNTVLIVISKINKKKELFIPEEQKNVNDDESNSLYDTERVDDQSGSRIRDETIVKHRGAQEYWSGLERFLVQNVDKIAEVANKSLQKQLPDNAYLKNVSEAEAKKELSGVIRKVISSTSNELRNGNVAFSKLKNFIKSAFGGVENNDIFNILYIVIKASLEYFVVAKMNKNILDEVRNMRRDEAAQEFAILKALETKKKNSEQALRNYRLVSASNRINRVASMVVDDIDYYEPEAMVPRLNAAYQLERKMDMILDGTETPDASGKSNHQVNITQVPNQITFMA